MAVQSKARYRKGSGEEKAKQASLPTAAKSSFSVHRRLGLILVILGLICYLWLQFFANSSEPLVYGFRVVRKYPHDPKAFTQGLLWLNGSLYESVGNYGHSAVREVRLEDGKYLRQVKNEKSEFGEGLVHFKGELLQLLWRVNDVIRYSAKAGKGGHLERKLQQYKTPLRDGWGLETDGESLLVTDNGPDVFFIDPDTFEVRRQVRVTDDGRAVQMVNELEMINGELWANIFGNECLARIAPDSGKVRSWVLLEGMFDREDANDQARGARRAAPDVMNGIAWDPEGQRLFVTGKLWPILFEIEVVPANGVSLEYARKRCIPRENIFRAR